MSKPNEYVEFLLEQLESLGPVEAKRMFGGFGVYCDALMFGIVANDQFYLKVDDTNRPDFEAADLEPFTFTRGTRTFAMSYYEAPPDALDDREELCRWARDAFAAATRAAKAKAPKKRRRKKKA